MAAAVDDLPDVDLHAVAEHRDLVDERDVDRPEDVLEQLRELGDLERRDRHDLVADRAVQRARALEALGRHAADDLRRGAQGVVGAARVDPLGREGEVERARPRLQARLLEQRRQPLARGARVGRRLEHDELALLEHARERGAGGDQRLQIGLAVLVQRGRHRDDDGVDLRQRRVARRRVQALAHGGEPLGGDVLDVARPGLDRRDLGGVGVKRDDVVAGLGELDRQRQPDVPEPDDADAHAGRCLFHAVVPRSRGR